MHALALALSLAATGPVLLEVDLRDSALHTIRSRILIPARPGPLKLAFPKWIPGEHGPRGRVTDLVDVHVTAGGKEIAFSRGDLDPYVFQVVVPPGADLLEVTLRRVAAPDTARGGALLSFLDVVLYPLGTPVRDQRWQATLLVPADWQAGSALRTVASEPGRVTFEPVDLDTLGDSPVALARHRREIPLGPPGGRPVSAVVVAEEESALEFPSTWKQRLERLVAEADALFGARHFDRYCFLLAAVEGVKGSMLEHHQSVAIGIPPEGLPAQGDPLDLSYVLPHEYVHSWNGKHRRPRGMAVADFQEPLRTRDLWVYEGLTEYLGYVLSTRSGFLAPAGFRELAAADLWAVHRPSGRPWRTLDDAAATFHAYAEAPDAWSGARRSPWAVYIEGLAAWLEADALIRERSAGARSLDDFARAFLGAESGSSRVRTYERPDVLAALEAVERHPWKEFFAARTESLAGVVEDAVDRTGWRLAYAPTLGPYLTGKIAARAPGRLVAGASLGLGFDAKQAISDVRPGSPGAAAGLTPGLRVLAINGRRLGASSLERGLQESRRSGRVELLVEEGDLFRTVPLAYDGGPRFFSLERIPERPDVLERILAPRVP